MNRREFLGLAAKGALGVSALSLAGCDSSQIVPQAAAGQVAAAVADASLPSIDWQMATSWPANLDTIFGGAQIFAERVAAMTGGKFKITPHPAGELAPALKVLDVVSQGAAPIGHTSSYYYMDKSPATAFGTSLPFGLTAQQQNSWLYEGGGLALMQDFFARKFNIIQFPAGNTGAQMGGWFRKEINTVADLQGLKMRIAGPGGQVMSRLGVTVQTLPGGEIYAALESGAIDSAEWVGPYDDEKLGLNKATTFYYTPGWWEPGPTLDVQINLSEWNKLPAIYKEIIQTASYQANMQMLARYDARNTEALERLLAQGVQLRTYSTEILEAAQTIAFDLFDEYAASDADFKAIFAEWKPFRDRAYAWSNLNEGVFERFVYAAL